MFSECKIATFSQTTKFLSLFLRCRAPALGSKFSNFRATTSRFTLTEKFKINRHSAYYDLAENCPCRSKVLLCTALAVR